MTQLLPVAALCVRNNSPYQQMAGVECYDARRDAWTYRGAMPIVAHPPCRAWSKYLRHQAKPSPMERELGLYCCSLLRLHGGVLEHPAESLLFAAGGLPPPGDGFDGRVVSIRVNQGWWGTRFRKATWLALAGVAADLLELPYRLLPPQRFNEWGRTPGSTGSRAGTTPAFASWLIAAARSCYP